MYCRRYNNDMYFNICYFYNMSPKKTIVCEKLIIENSTVTISTMIYVI